MTTIDQTPFAKLEADGRLLNPVLKDVTKSGRFAFRGIVGLKYPPQVGDAKRPPDIVADQVIASSKPGESTLEFFAAYLLSFEYLSLVTEVLGDILSPSGKYIIFANNIDLRAKYTVVLNGITFTVLPIDDATLYNELLETLSLEKNDLKKFDTAGKQDTIIDAALNYNATYEEISFEEGVKRMGPVRNRNENRPV